ncbi:MAG: hypothetical protein NTW65_11920 [Deltaproteobacteria bacterium]|nr:hypothetical protein [Deltaproteobacteria bacterium]
MIFDNINISQAIVLFAIYSFMGWIIEAVYRSISERQFINAGFLYGPFIPIYGFGAAFIISLESLIHPWPLPIELIIYGLVLTLTEYFTGLIFEKVFKLKLWDYSDSRFNIHGRVCLLFSLFWTIMALAFVTLIHPAVLRHVQSQDGSFLRVVSIVLLIYGTTDLVFSITTITAFRRKIAYLYSEYFNLSDAEIEKIFSSFQRLRSAYPNLRRYIDNNIDMKIKSRISTFLKSILSKISLNMEGRKPFEHEFYDIINDIYEHDEVLKLKEHYHHNSSIYEHVMDVSYFSYRACKFLKLDYQSAARGALLHDFFLYDWRNHDVPDLPEEKFHGIEHPKIALVNAEKHFTLNDIEKDIVIKHMWPLTLVPPKYKESFIVSFADKYLASKEFVTKFKRNKNSQHAKKQHKAHHPLKKHEDRHTHHDRE